MVPSSHVHPSTRWSLVAGELSPEQLDPVSSDFASCSGCATELERKRAVQRLLHDSAAVEIPDPVRQRLEVTLTQLGEAAGEGVQPPGR